MSQIVIRELQQAYKEEFLSAMQRSEKLHHPWVKVPTTSDEFDAYLEKYQQPNHKSYLVFTESGLIAGVFNISEIIRGVFENAYLGFYVAAEFAGQGYMKAGLKLVLQQIFMKLMLHRIEANIQPENMRSIHLVKSCGFRYEGYSPRYLRINEEWCGHEHWAMTYEDYIRDEPDVLNKDHVELVAYQSEWQTLAQEEILKIRSVLPVNNIIDIQHVGSTAIPGIVAKPVIDIQIAVHSLDDMKLIAVPLLQKLHYEYWDSNPDKDRMFFAKGMPPYGERRTHHIHIVEEQSHHWHQKLVFRDYLRAHPEVAQEYGRLKVRLAKEHALDREKYTEAKSDFVNKVLSLLDKK